MCIEQKNEYSSDIEKKPEKVEQFNELDEDVFFFEEIEAFDIALCQACGDISF